MDRHPGIPSGTSNRGRLLSLPALFTAPVIYGRVCLGLGGPTDGRQHSNAGKHLRNDRQDSVAGTGVAADPAAARALFRSAAEQGHPWAFWRMPTPATGPLTFVRFVGSMFWLPSTL